jgi:hypothetical protein
MTWEPFRQDRNLREHLLLLLTTKGSLLTFVEHLPKFS